MPSLRPIRIEQGLQSDVGQHARCRNVPWTCSCILLFDYVAYFGSYGSLVSDNRVDANTETTSAVLLVEWVGDVAFREALAV